MYFIYYSENIVGGFIPTVHTKDGTHEENL